MSKSVGNIIDPFALIDKYGPDALRYYLMSDIVIGKDADFSEERLVGYRYKVDLSDTLGNLLNRSLPLAERHTESRLSRPQDDYAPTEGGHSAATLLSEAVDYYVRYSNRFAFDESCITALGIARTCNLQIQAKRPWDLAKDSARIKELSFFLYYLAESLRVIAILISPVMPKAAHGIFDQLNWKMELSGKEERFSLADAKWGGLPDGHVVGKPVPLFPRIED